jgi:ribonuclease HII
MFGHLPLFRGLCHKGKPVQLSICDQDKLGTAMPDYVFETELACRVAGVDEVGRGPLAGPVTAAAVVLDPARIPDGLNDSKKLTARARERLYGELMECAEVSVAHASVAEIDELNILRASHLAMERALAGLEHAPEHALIDGNMIPRGLALPATAVIKGDARSVSISAASIVAKICRDRVLVDLAQHHPGYGWETNMGYASKKHMDALAKLGVTPHHRRSFKPIHNILYQEKFVSD